MNCAGTTRFVPHSDLDGLDDELINTILATNVRGAFATVRAFRPLLEKSPLPGGGVVVNLSSAAGNIAIGSNVMYCASKAALDNMTKSLARALAPRIRVVSVSPGPGRYGVRQIAGSKPGAMSRPRALRWAGWPRPRKSPRPSPPSSRL